MKVGIVNDMAMAREALRRVVASMPEHQIAWMANDGVEAVELARKNRPDLILMDLIMPRMGGAEATRRIMAESPCPILIVTSTVGGNINKVFEAMGHGALDVVNTPTLGPRGEVEGASHLIDKIAMVAKLIGQPANRERSSAAETGKAAVPLGAPLLLLGASTGGPHALSEVLAALPRNRDTCVIMVQHVDVAFSPSLAQWLEERSRHKVELIKEGDRPGPGRWLLAATNDHLVMSAGHRLTYTAEPRDLCYRPSVDICFSSVAVHWSEPGIAVLLTGMGRDGAEGLLNLRRQNWHTIAQDEASSVVWGMPRAAKEIGAAVEVLPLSKIAPAISRKIGNRI
jgi:two-component system response regulator WspF